VGDREDSQISDLFSIPGIFSAATTVDRAGARGKEE